MESIDALVDLIVSGVSDIEANYSREGIPIPSLDEPYTPTQAEAVSMPSIDVVVTAALHLIATLRPAPMSVLSSSLAMFETASLGSVSRYNIAEIVREAGPEGMHVRDIGEKAGTSPDKIGRILRYLASRHIFSEVAPDMFANNRLSSVIDSGKSAQQNFAEPLKKHEQTTGIPALLDHWTDESLKSAAYIPDFLSEKSMMFSEEPNATPLNLAFKTSDAWFDWLAKPGNELRQVRFGAAMNGTIRLFPPSLVLGLFPWSELEEGSLVVDVGGGIGSTTLTLAKSFPSLRFTVQDLPQAIADGRTFWQEEYPEAIASGLVELQEHNFFSPQPIQNASVFLLRAILHDWPTPHVKKILSHLRSAARLDTKVILIEQVIPYPTNAAVNQSALDIINAEPPARPSPLLPGAGSLAYSVDLMMFNLVNGKERTIGGWVEAVDGTGWRITEVVHGPMCGIILVPV